MNVMSDVDILWEATVWTLAYTMLVFREDPSVQWKFLLSLLGRLFRPIQTWENGCCLISWISQSCGKNKEIPTWMNWQNIENWHKTHKNNFRENQIRFRYIEIVLDSLYNEDIDRKMKVSTYPLLNGVNLDQVPLVLFAALSRLSPPFSLIGRYQIASFGPGPFLPTFWTLTVGIFKKWNWLKAHSIIQNAHNSFIVYIPFRFTCTRWIRVLYQFTF